MAQPKKKKERPMVKELEMAPTEHSCGCNGNCTEKMEGMINEHIEQLKVEMLNNPNMLPWVASSKKMDEHDHPHEHIALNYADNYLGARINRLLRWATMYMNLFKNSNQYIFTHDLANELEKVLLDETLPEVNSEEG